MRRTNFGDGSLCPLKERGEDLPAEAGLSAISTIAWRRRSLKKNTRGDKKLLNQRVALRAVHAVMNVVHSQLRLLRFVGQA